MLLFFAAQLDLCAVVVLDIGIVQLLLNGQAEGRQVLLAQRGALGFLFGGQRALLGDFGQLVQAGENFLFHGHSLRFWGERADAHTRTTP